MNQLTNNQLLLSMVGLMISQTALLVGFLKWYIDAKVDPIAKNVDMLVQYMISHEGKLARLEERVKGLEERTK